MNTKHIILARSYVVFIFVCVFALAILVQARRVQVIRPDHWYAMSDSIRIESRPIEARRGNIYSSDNRLLASTLPTFNVRMDLRADGLQDSVFTNNIVGLSQKLHAYYPNKSAKAWEKELTNGRKNGHRYHLIRKNVNYRTMLAMRTWPIWNKGKYKGGLILEENKSRKKPFGKLAARTIGYVKKVEDKESGVGLESSFNKFLRGTNGLRMEQRVTGGAWIPISDDYEVVPKDGSDIITTIDVNVQDVAETALENVLEINKADWGSAIVMEVETGKIKAIANLTKQKNGSFRESYNYAIGHKYEPGSTMKLATLASLLEDGHVTINDLVNITNGRSVVAGRRVADSGNKSNYNFISIQKAFEISSNVAFTKLADKYYRKNPEQFLGNLDAFHLSKPYGIEIEGEAEPYFRRPSDNGWSKMSVSSIAFGYEIQMTPLQMLSFYNTVANNGKLMKPYLVESIQDKGETIKQFHPQTLNENTLSESTINQLKRSLEGVVQPDGTGSSLVSEHYTSAGKTGTTKLHEQGYNYGKFHIASFAGYFPAEQPKYSCIVVVNKPTAGKYYGGSVAGPVFKAIADMLYARSLDVQIPINKEDTVQEDLLLVGERTKIKTLQDNLVNPIKPIETEWVLVHNKDTTVTNIVPREIQWQKVPNVQQMGLDDAVYILENAGYKVKTIGNGIVKNQSVKPGKALATGQAITLKLGI